MFRRVRWAVLSAAVLACAVPSWAAPGKAPADPQTLELIQQLHRAHHLLAEANHDYDGHRARAAEEIHKAVKALEASMPHHKHKPLQSAVKPAREPAVREEQAKSDEQLREARKLLKVVEKELATSSGEHHQKALADVARAVEEIDIALKIK